MIAKSLVKYNVVIAKAFVVVIILPSSVCCGSHHEGAAGDLRIPDATSNRLAPATAACLAIATISAAAVGLLVVDGAELLLPTTITSSIFECFLHPASARSILRAVVLAANPGSPKPAGGSPVGRTQQEHYKALHAQLKCKAAVCVCHRARTRFCAAVFAFTHASIRASMSTHTLQLVEG